jgi:hypothetical protein
MPVYDSGISSSVKRFVTYIDETIVVSKMTHEYKLALRRRVLQNGVTIKNNICYNNVIYIYIYIYMEAREDA